MEYHSQMASLCALLRITLAGLFEDDNDDGGGGW